MRERRLEQVRSVLAQEQGVADVRIGHRRWVEEWHHDLIRLDQLEHPGKEHRLELEAALVIGIREDVENVLHDAQEVLLEEYVGDRGVSTREIVDDLQAHCDAIPLAYPRLGAGISTYSSDQSQRYPASCA